MHGLAPDRIVALGTVSKSLAPAVRLGWVLCTPALAEAVGDEKGRSDRGSPVIDQLAVAALIESGRYDRHLRRMRATYANRRRALAEASPATRPPSSSPNAPSTTASPPSVTSSKDRPSTAQNGCHPPDGARPSHKVY